MARQVVVRHAANGLTVVARAAWCDSFLCKLRGLSLRRSMAEGSGLILVESGEGRWSSAIHMFGMRFDLGVVWINAKGVVVDARHARPWRIYLPRVAARYTLETSPPILMKVKIGDVLEFHPHGATE